jgi:subtilisin family serine protease
MLAADLTRLVYDATLLDQDAASTTVDSFFVAFDKSMSATAIKNATGAKSVDAFPLIPNSFNLTFDSSMSLEQAAGAFSSISGFKYLYPNLPLERVVKFVPNDPLFVSQWHLQNTGQTGGTVGADANITGAWDTQTGAGVVIGIVDDGVQLAHPDLAANVASGEERREDEVPQRRKGRMGGPGGCADLIQGWRQGPQGRADCGLHRLWRQQSYRT